MIPEKGKLRKPMIQTSHFKAVRIRIRVSMNPAAESTAFIVIDLPTYDTLPAKFLEYSKEKLLTVPFHYYPNSWVYCFRLILFFFFFFFI